MREWRMRIKTLNRSQAESITSNDSDEKVAIISIGERANLTEEAFHDILRLYFHDTDKKDATKLVAGIELKPITSDHASQILDFVDRMVEDEVDVLLVHCRAGVSRSTGTALAINEIYNGDRFIRPHWIHYNRLVYNTIVNEYWKRNNDE